MCGVCFFFCFFFIHFPLKGTRTSSDAVRIVCETETIKGFFIPYWVNEPATYFSKGSRIHTYSLLDTSSNLDKLPAKLICVELCSHILIIGRLQANCNWCSSSSISQPVFSFCGECCLVHCRRWSWTGMRLNMIINNGEKHFTCQFNFNQNHLMMNNGNQLAYTDKTIKLIRERVSNWIENRRRIPWNQITYQTNKYTFVY